MLRRVYTKVSEKLDAQSVARNMFERNALTLRELESIQSKHSEPVKAAERLLDVVMNQSGNVYEFLMNALKLTGQKHVCEMIVIGTDEGNRPTPYGRAILVANAVISLRINVE